eukprot:comp22351_c0_seq1/m.53907 comp22351_c0_seq1/g.53907  ORF comp22351_c0_seq1/g.53907 comp22351_c0_seq1/m.53907 type:complete len:450 (-) comp22351_c0_seq1:335-1684(-)
MVAAERVDHALDGRGFAAACRVVVEHALHGARLHAVDKARGLLGEERVPGQRGAGLGGRERLDCRRIVGGRAVCAAAGSAVGAFDLALALVRRVLLAGRVEHGLRVVLVVGDRLAVLLGGGLDAERDRDDGGHVGFRAVDLDGDLELVADGGHDAETLLVVGSAAAHKDLDAMVADLDRVLADCAHNALECVGDIGEVGNAATNEEHLAVLAEAEHEIEDCLCVLVGLHFRRCAGVLAVVCELVREAHVCDGVCVDHGRAAAGNHGPDAALWVEHGELERSAGLFVERGDVCLLLCDDASKGRREVDAFPLRCTQVLCGLVELCCAVENVDVSRLAHHQWIDLEIRKVQVGVCLEQRHNEARQGWHKVRCHMCQQLLFHLVKRQSRAWKNIDRLRLAFNMSNVNPALVVEQNLSSFRDTEHTNIHFIILSMLTKCLNNKSRQISFRSIH